MTFLQHNESMKKHLLRPRHPIVVALNMLGMLIGAAGFGIADVAATKSYFAAMVLLYFFSALHHWHVYTPWTTRLDHAMIFIFIAFTAVPYWGAYIPLFGSTWTGLILIVVIALVGGISKLFTFFPRILSGALYGMASLPIIAYMTYHVHDIGMLYYTLWMTGIALYMVQLFVYTWRLCELRPGLFGHREVQHTPLLIATSLQGWVALQIVG